MAHAYRTTAEVAHFADTDMDLVVRDVLDEAPFLAQLAARSVQGITFKYARQTANPAVDFRDVNDGQENTKTATEQVTVNLGLIDASVAVDKAVAQADERGTAHAVGFEAVNHLRAAMRKLEEQIINGTVGGSSNATAFEGFADQANLNGAADSMVVSAGGTTANTGSSAYLVRVGEGDVQALWGQDGAIMIGERQIVPWIGATGTFPAYYHDIMAWAGLKIGSTYSVARIGNLTEDSGRGLTDDLIADALSLFPAARQPNLIVLNRRSLKQLQQSRTATNATGAPAPFPMDAFGVPIVVTDSISSTETLLA